MLLKLEREDKAKKKPSKKKQIVRKENMKGRSKPKTKGIKSIKRKYNKLKSKTAKKMEAKQYKLLAAVHFTDFYSHDKDVSVVEEKELKRTAKRYKKEMDKKLKNGRKNRKDKISFAPGESFLAAG